MTPEETKALVQRCLDDQNLGRGKLAELGLRYKVPHDVMELLSRRIRYAVHNGVMESRVRSKGQKINADFEGGNVEIEISRSSEDGVIVVQIDGPHRKEDTASSDSLNAGLPRIRVWLNEALINWGSHFSDSFDRWIMTNPESKEPRKR